MAATYEKGGFLETGQKMADGLATAVVGFIMGLLGISIEKS